eukprot:jgi/Tetstr1/450400/TSEL_037436.t1
MNVRTLCLSFLYTQDASGYEIRKLCTEGGGAYFVEASFGSIYPALAKLEDDELVTSRIEHQDGKPSKKIYSITEAGRAAFCDALHEPLGDDVFRSPFLLFARFAHLLDPDLVKSRIEDRLAYLDAQIVELKELQREIEGGDDTSHTNDAWAEAALAQAEAGLAQAQLDLETNTSLRERGLAPANTANSVQVALAAAEAQVSSAQAALDNARAELDRTEIVAEVSGLVQAPIATRGSMLSQGSVCATIVQLDPIVFSGSVAEANITLARTGLPATLHTVTNQDATGEVTYVAASADDATRSFPVEIEFANPDFSIREGVTATATVNMGSMPGHLLPQSVLTLNDEGVLGVRAVQDGIVAFYPVTIVSDTREGVWVTGLPQSVDIITIGQEFVIEGQSV